MRRGVPFCSGGCTVASGSPEVAVVGAGPTGLGAAWRLEELGQTSWRLHEASAGPGGLAASVVDPQGFTWDYGCHAFHSHYAYVDRLLDELLEGEWSWHRRATWIRIRERWIPYPLQNNLGRLPRDEVARCVDGLLEVRLASEGHTPPKTFKEWLLASFGTGLYEVFLGPYNSKVWGYAPERLDVGWTAERVPPVDVRRVARAVILDQDDVGWGPNARFRFPVRGGTGAIWQALAGRLPPERVSFGRQVTAVHARRHRLVLEGGEEIGYDALLSTMPLDLLIARLTDLPELKPFAKRFLHTSTHVVGLGFEGPEPAGVRSRSWMYFPESDVPFHRVTVASNFSPFNVARPGAQWSLLSEISETADKSVDARSVVRATLAGLAACGLVDSEARLVSRWHCRLEYGYPTPWLGRDEVLGAVNNILERYGILSRGRFGAWKYEVSNQDHSLMQGVEVVERLLRGGCEPTFHGEMRDSIGVSGEQAAMALRAAGGGSA